MTTTNATHVHARGTDDNERRYWPLDRHAWAQAVAVWVAATVTLTALGLLIVHVLQDGRFGRTDLDVSEWFRDHRTPSRVDAAQIGAGIADTFTVIPICAVFLAFAAWRWRRWHDVILVVGALLYEKAIFLPVTLIVGRDRPPIGQLDGNPPSSSFFSGHVAAAVALYVGLVIVVRWHTSSPILRAVATVLAAAVVVVVAASRLLLGMHYLSDVIAGLAVGGVALVIAHRGVTGTERRRGRPDPALVEPRDHALMAKPTASSTP